MKRLFLLYIFFLIFGVTCGYGAVGHAADMGNGVGSLGPVRQFSARDGLTDEQVTGFVQDKHGMMWISTWGGLCRYDGYDFQGIKSTEPFNDKIRGIRIDKVGKIICRTDGGCYSFDTRTYKFQRLNGDQKTNPSHFKDMQDNFWEVREHRGMEVALHRHHPAKALLTTDGAQGRALMVDRQGRLWVGSREDRMLRVYSSSGRLLSSRNVGHSVYSLMQDGKGRVWIGCKEPGGLLVCDGTLDGGFTQVSNDRVYDIAEDSRGNIWIAGFGDGIKVIPVGSLSSATELLKTGTVSIIGTASLMGTASLKVRHLIFAQDGYLYATCTTGLLRGKVNLAHPEKTRLTLLTHKDGLCSDALTDVVEGTDGYIIIGTESRGLMLMKEGKVVRMINSSNSTLLSDNVLSITSIHNTESYFVVSQSMVEMINMKEHSTVCFGPEFWADECHFSEAKPVMMKDGTWSFGHDGGVIQASHHALFTRGYIPYLAFTSLMVSGKGASYCVAMNDSVVVDAEDRNFTLTFSALDYTDNSGILYRTRLDDSPWTHASGERSVSFFDMSPGEYTLMVQSTDRYGRWVENTRKITIIVKPYWYETWWFKVLMLCLILGILYGIARTILYIRRINRQRSELLEKYMSQVALATAASVSGPKSDADMREDTSAGISSTSSNSTPEKKVIEPLSPALSENDRKFLERVRQYIKENISNSDANIDDMASSAAMSRSNLNRKLRSLVGITAAQLLIDARMREAHRLLEENAQTGACDIQDIAYKCGYSDPRYFSKCFKGKYGISPSEVR